MREIRGSSNILYLRDVFAFSLCILWEFNLALYADHKYYVAALELGVSIYLVDVQRDLERCL